jgi:hypothetical protein
VNILQVPYIIITIVFLDKMLCVNFANENVLNKYFLTPFVWILYSLENKNFIMLQ